MSFEEIDELIQDWRSGKKRAFRGRTFAENRRGYRQLVARVATEFLPRIREFITIDSTVRKEVLKDWKHLLADLEEDMRMLDAFDPLGKTQFFAASVIAQAMLRDKAALKAFELSKPEPIDAFGNPEFISGMAACLDTILDQTYHAMRGMTGKNLRISLMRKASQTLHNALSQGVVKTLEEMRSLLQPQLAVVEMELEKFHFGKMSSTT
ncbi:MAG: hypothetical protein ACFFD8_05280 [Candidatus Thorarchaeota archaeon]